MADFTSRRGFFSTLASACLASIGLRPQPILAPPPLVPATAEDVTISYSYSAASLPPGIRIDPGTRVVSGTLDLWQGESHPAA